METLELNVAKRAIVKTRHVILVRALVLLVDVNVYIYRNILQYRYASNLFSYAI
jgi:hypothetical protein